MIIRCCSLISSFSSSSWSLSMWVMMCNWSVNLSSNVGRMLSRIWNWNVGSVQLIFSVKSCSWDVNRWNCSIRRILWGSSRWNCWFKSSSLVVIHVLKNLTHLQGVWVLIYPNKSLSKLCSSSSKCNFSYQRVSRQVVVVFSPVLCSNRCPYLIKWSNQRSSLCLFQRLVVVSSRVVVLCNQLWYPKASSWRSHKLFQANMVMCKTLYFKLSSILRVYSWVMVKLHADLLCHSYVMLHSRGGGCML